MIIKHENVKRNKEHPQELKYWKSRVATKVTSKKLKHMFLMWILSWTVSTWLNCQLFPNNFAVNFVILYDPILDLVFFSFQIDILWYEPNTPIVHLSLPHCFEIYCNQKRRESKSRSTHALATADPDNWCAANQSFIYRHLSSPYSDHLLTDLFGI